MELTVLFNTIMKLAILIGIGMFLASKIPFTNDIRKMLIFLIVNISLPALILNGFLQVEVEDSLLKQIVIAFIFGCCFILFSLFFGGLAAKLLKFKEIALVKRLLSAFGNTGFIGIPLCASIFGPKGAVLAAAFDGGTALLVWSLGVLLVKKKNS